MEVSRLAGAMEGELGERPRREFPLAPRALVGAAALVVAVGFALLAPWMELQAGFPWAAAYLALTGGALAFVLGAAAVAPAQAQRALDRVGRVNLRDPAHVGAFALLLGALYFVFGFAMAQGVAALEAALTRPPVPAGPVNGASVLSGLVIHVAVLVLPVLLYVSVVGDRGPAETFAALGLDLDGAGRQALRGVVLAVGFVVALVAASAVLSRYVDLPQNDRGLAIAKSLTVGGAVVVAAGAAFSEEVLFRGFLLPRIGVVGQALLFSLAHLSYLDPVEIAVTFALGLAFGVMRRRTGSLWGPLAAHFAFDLIELILGLYAPAPS
jgi:membrane protease YdiL (CAAX protease family)